MARAASWNPLESGIDLFRIGGIQIRLDFSWFVIFLLILWSLSVGYFPRFYPEQQWSTYWVAGLIATLLFFFSILAHELAHATMAIRSASKFPRSRCLSSEGCRTPRRKRNNRGRNSGSPSSARS